MSGAETPHFATLVEAGLDLERLTDTELRDWPSLARSWIDLGFRSPALTDFAGLTRGEAPVLADLMLDVLRSLGVHVAVERDIARRVFTVSGFERRCRAAICVPALDLRRTWRAIDVDLVVSDQHGTPPVSVQTRVGDRNSSGSEPMTARMPDHELVETSARQISDTLQVQIGVRWPLCIDHDIVMTPRSHPDRSCAVEPSWWCDGHRGPIARIGELSPSSATFETAW